MSDNPRLLLAETLRDEIDKLLKIKQEVSDYRADFADRAAESVRDLRSIAGALTDIYQGAENAFQRITRTTKEGLPSGPEWHRLLLDQMTREVGEVRPPVISDQTRQPLEEFRKFRHRARHMYGFDLAWKDIGPLLQIADDTINLLVNDLGSFCAVLEQIDEEDE
jgi:hypothetical protein